MTYKQRGRRRTYYALITEETQLTWQRLTPVPPKTTNNTPEAGVCYLTIGLIIAIISMGLIAYSNLLSATLFIVGLSLMVKGKNAGRWPTYFVSLLDPRPWRPTDPRRTAGLYSPDWESVPSCSPNYPFINTWYHCLTRRVMCPKESKNYCITIYLYRRSRMTMRFKFLCQFYQDV